MSNSTIKQKVGKCLDCPEGSPEKPLIAKRCNTHYWTYRASVKTPKSEWKEVKRVEMKTFLKQPQKPICKVSKKRAVLNAKYMVLKSQFMGKKENQICPITKNPTVDIHHMKGKVGFADEWARINNIPLLIDIRFWKALSREGHTYVELHPEWAKENGYSLNRL